MFHTPRGPGLLGKASRLQMRHERREALREADVVILAGEDCIALVPQITFLSSMR